MRPQTRVLMMTLAIPALLGLGCGSSSGSPSDGAATGTAGTNGGAGTGGGTFMAIDPCPTAASYMTGATTIMALDATFKYSPACLKVPVGTKVTIQATSIHPLSGLTTGSANNPIPPGGMTTDQMVTFATAGFYPFHCDVHATIGMTGVVWAQ